MKQLISFPGTAQKCRNMSLQFIKSYFSVELCSRKLGMELHQHSVTRTFIKANNETFHISAHSYINMLTSQNPVLGNIALSEDFIKELLVPFAVTVVECIAVLQQLLARDHAYILAIINKVAPSAGWYNH